MVAADVVPGPQTTKVRALDREFADKVRQIGIIDVGADQRAQARYDAPDPCLPIVVEILDGAVEKGDAQDVDPGLVQRRERDCQRVGGQDVHVAAQHQRGAVAQVVKEHLGLG